MKTVTFRKPLYNAFIPPALFLLNVLFNKLLEILRATPGFYWAYTIGKMFSLFMVLIGCVLLPVMNFKHFKHKESLSKRDAAVYVLIGFSPLLYVALRLLFVLTISGSVFE
jgi:ATP/ADP translocase